MKRALILASALALGLTATTYAANPFSDVPAGHWAYDSIEKLAAAGVIDGYGDGTFGGDKLMTRYEMAQIVAKAMAKAPADRFSTCRTLITTARAATAITAATEPSLEGRDPKSRPR